MGLTNWLVGGDATNAINPQLNHGSYMGNYLQQQLGQVGNRAAPTAQAAQLGAASQLNLGANAQIDPQMMALSGRLGAIASGQAKGAGELAVDRQVGQATAAQQAAAAAARGSNAALAARAAARNTMDLGVAGAGQAKQAALGDQQTANGQLGGLLAGMRGQNIDAATQNAQLAQQYGLTQGQFQQQTNLANQQAQLQQSGLNQQGQLGYLGQLLGLDQAQMQALLAKQQIGLQDQGHLGSLLQSAGTIGAAAASDRALKTNIADGGAKARKMLDAIVPYTFDYLDERHGEGEQLGVMAQDLEAAGLGHAVVDTPDGKHVHGSKLVTTLVALVASLHQRVNELEGR